MAYFSYEAAGADGRKVKATAEAATEAALRSDLKAKGLIPIRIAAGSEKKGISLSHVTSKDLLTFTQELGSLLESGLPVDRALLILAEHADKKTMREVLRATYISVQKGESLSQGLARHPKVFPRLYVNMVRAGEAGGIMEVVIKRLAAFIETSVAFKEEVTSALIYPILLVVVGGLAVSVLMIYVVPKFATIFSDMGQALPTPTRILMEMSHAFSTYWWLGLGIIAGAGILINTYAKTNEGRIFIDELKLHIPVFRTLHMKLIIARFTRTIGTLLQSGVNVLESIRVSREVIGNEVVARKLAAIEEGVRKGRGISGPLMESGVFPAVVSHMLAVGEEAGRLEETFLLVADRFEGESRAAIKRTVALIEPLMILMMGLIVGFIVISMLMAVFSINDIPI